MSSSTLETIGQESLVRFWRAARGYWRGGSRWYAWGLIALLAVCVVLQLLVQYRLNLWNRDFFNALDRRDAGEIWQQAGTVLVLVAQSVVLAITAVWGRMSFQRRWREWLTARLLTMWRPGDARHAYAGADEPQFAEYRISEDVRVATDAPIDLAVGLLASVLTAGTFVTVLWNVGGSLDLAPLGMDLELPGYLVFAAAIYASVTTTMMVVIGRDMASVIARKNQAESEFKYAIARLRQYLAAPALGADTARYGALTAAASASLKEVVAQWSRLCGQLMRTTLIGHGNSLLAPLIGLVLCVPNFIHGAMPLGEMTQSAAAFVAVQGAFSWLVDNYPRLADWASSASRVGSLVASFERGRPATERN
jgi:putative ATP-binding cassette transporter